MSPAYRPIRAMAASRKSVRSSGVPELVGIPGIPVRVASEQPAIHHRMSLSRAFLFGLLLLIHSVGCEPQDRARVWNEIRQGAVVPLARVEQSQAPPVETKSLGDDFERRVYRRKGESDVLIVVVDRGNSRAVRELIVTPNALGKVPYEIWVMCAAIRQGDRVSVADIEQSFGAPVKVESIDARTERRTYRGDERLLRVTVDTTSQLSSHAIILTPYTVCGDTPFVPKADTEEGDRGGE
jgi:hypothetical protein